MTEEQHWKEIEDIMEKNHVDPHNDFEKEVVDRLGGCAIYLGMESKKQSEPEQIKTHKRALSFMYLTDVYPGLAPKLKHQIGKRVLADPIKFIESHGEAIVLNQIRLTRTQSKKVPVEVGQKRLQRVGNSLAIVLPAASLESKGWKASEPVVISEQGNGFVITKHHSNE